VIHGQFIQENTCAPCPSRCRKGRFVLAEKPRPAVAAQNPAATGLPHHRQGIARRDANGWQTCPAKSAGAEQNRLFLAVLQGDSSGLQRDFELALPATPGTGSCA
jgi:hypothetical protein